MKKIATIFLSGIAFVSSGGQVLAHGWHETVVGSAAHAGVHLVENGLLALIVTAGIFAGVTCHQKLSRKGKEDR